MTLRNHKAASNALHLVGFAVECDKNIPRVRVCVEEPVKKNLHRSDCNQRAWLVTWHRAGRIFQDGLPGGSMR
jgi:hypothetical protein